MVNYHIQELDKVQDKGLTKRLEKFQERVIKLSVAIDDYSKTIDLLLSTIKAHQEHNDNIIKEENAKLRLNFNLANASFNERISQCLDEYARVTKAKEEIANEIEILSKKKSQENELTKTRLLELSQTLDGNIKNAFSEWDSRKDEREEMWLSKKVNYVRACTVDALQPEIKRLSVTHEFELTKLTEEAAVRRRYVEKEMDIEFHREYNNCLDVTEKRQSLLCEGREKLWRDKIREIESAHQKRLDDITNEAGQKLKERLLSCKGKEYEEEEKFKKEIGSLNADLNIKLKEIQDKRIRCLEEICRDSKLKLDQIHTQMTNKKEEWEQSEKLRLKVKLNEKINGMNTSIQQRRDGDIEVLLRMNQTAEDELEEKIKAQKQEQSLSTSYDLGLKIKCIKERNELLNRQLSCATKDVEKIRVEQQQILEQVESKEQLIAKAETGYMMLMQAQEKINCAERSRHSSILAEIKESDLKRSDLEAQSLELRRKLDSIEA